MGSSSSSGQSGNWSKHLYVVLVLSLFGIGAIIPTLLDDFFLPGSQPGQVSLESPGRCLNCHEDPGNASTPVSIGSEWQGSMMSQAMRDPLYLAGLAIANQDASESGDLCIRCHSPEGWLESRSTPTDGSALTGSDIDGVHCDVCHSLVKPTPLGENPYPNDADYIALTLQADQDLLATLVDIPPQSGNGMFVVSGDGAKRGPFSDAQPKHQWYYSPFHKEAELCATCHDVSNPAFNRLPDDSYAPNAMGSPSNSFNTYDMFPIERTYSEWLMSEYNSEQGVYAPQFGGNKLNVSTCQDCHMKDVTGYGANKKGILLRNDLPLHDMTGGNTFVPELLKQLYPDDPMVNHAALDAGVIRARDMLQKAASMELTAVQTTAGYDVTVKVTNETGHKLPSGYPEGRRIWINLRAFDTNNSLIYESGNYDPNSAILTKDSDIKIYEVKPGLDATMAGITGLEEGPGFHFVLNNKIFLDNRIPPRGFTNAAFDQIQSPPVGVNYDDGQYWDSTVYPVPWNTSRVEASLYYQTTSKEFVEFLRDENTTNDAGQVMYDLWNTNGKSAPELMKGRQTNLPGFIPFPPVNLISQIEGNSILLSWDEAIGANNYIMNLNKAGEAGVNTSTSGKSLQLNGLPSGTLYFWRVRSANNAGVGDFSLSGQFTTPGNYCNVPEDLRVTGVNGGNISLAWNRVPSVIEYEILVKNTNDNSSFKRRVSQTEYTVESLISNTSYSFQIRSICNPGSVSQFSEPVTLSTENVLCEIPTGLYVDNITPVSAILHWDDMVSADHYNVTLKQGSHSITFTTASNQFVANELFSATKYEFLVRAFCSLDNSVSSDYSQASQFTTSGITCSTPQNLVISNVTDNSASLSWDQVSGASSYRLYYWISLTNEKFNIISVDPQVVLSGLKSGRSYQWMVQSICSEDQTQKSTLSQISNFNTTGELCTEVTSRTSFPIDSDSELLSWDPVANAEYYRIHYGIDGQYNWTVGETNDVQIQLNILTPSTTYVWRVQTVCSTVENSTSRYGDPSYFNTQSALAGMDNSESLKVTYDKWSNEWVISSEKFAEFKYQLFDITGKLLHTGFTRDGIISIPVNRKNELVILKIVSADTYYLKKLFIK